MTKKETTQIIELLRKEIVPAVGCTEPAAVALCVAKSVEVLGILPEKINVFLSANVLKNAIGVGIPNTGMSGLPIAVAMGALVGKSKYGLEVLKDVTSEKVKKGKQYVTEKRIDIKLKNNNSEKLYIEVESISGKNKSIVIIKKEHNNFVYISYNEKIILDKKDLDIGNRNVDNVQLNFKKVYDFSLSTPIEKINFILNAARLNKHAFEISKQGKYGHSVSRTISSNRGRLIFGYTPLARALSYTTGACDVRMDGVKVPIMSNSGSGNQGIAATLPVLSFAEDNCASDEELIRALVLSNLTAIYIKQNLGRLSALCGCVVASTGASCGITYLMGGNYEQLTYTIKNMIGNIAGMLCDGAKPSCALKISSGVSSAMISAVMAMENETVSSTEGIVDEDIDATIRNFTEIGKDAMQETDKKVLEIMTSKI